MTTNMRALLIFLSIVAVTYAAIFAGLMRIDAKPTNEAFLAMVTDHWTGAVYYCGLGKCIPVARPSSN